MNANVMRCILDNRNRFPMRIFQSREDAAQKIIRFQQSYGLPVDTLVFVPMGGLPLNDAFLSNYPNLNSYAFPVVKIPSTTDSRFGVGALDIKGNALLNEYALSILCESEDELQVNIMTALNKQGALAKRFNFCYPDSQHFSDKNILILDDGLSSGLTIEAVLNSIFEIGIPKAVNCLFPVAYSIGIHRIRKKFTNINIFSLFVDSEPIFLVDDFYYDFTEVR